MIDLLFSFVLGAMLLVRVIGECIILGMRFRENIGFHESVVVKEGSGHRRNGCRLRAPPQAAEHEHDAL
jgi:hypothetical protein